MKAKLKVDPRTLPPPPYPPAKKVRIKEKPDRPYEAMDYASDFKVDAEKMAARRKRAAESAARTLKNGYTPEQEQQIINLYKQGLTYAAIGKIMGKSKSAMKQKIDKMRKEQNFERECQLRSKYGGYTPAQDAVIREMRAQGKSYKAIGEQIGKSKEAVRKRYNMIGG